MSQTTVDHQCRHPSESCPVCLAEEVIALEHFGVVHITPDGQMDLHKPENVHECRDPEDCAWCHPISKKITMNEKNELECLLQDGSVQIFSRSGERLN